MNVLLVVLFRILFGWLMERHNSDERANIEADDAYVICRRCGLENWYGYGTCQKCGADLPRLKIR